MHIPDMATESKPDLPRGERIREVREEILKIEAQEKLSELLDVSRGAVGNWELGKGVKMSNLSKLADLASVRLDWLAYGRGPRLLSDEPNVPEPSNATKLGQVARSPVKIPQYGTAVGGEDGEFVLNGNRLDDVFAPPSLSGIPQAYAVYISGDSMSPRYDDGDTVFVHPKRRVKKGDYVIAQIHLVEDDPPLAYVKKLVRWTEKELILEQFNPPKYLTFDGGQVSSVHYVLRPGE